MKNQQAQANMTTLPMIIRNFRSLMALLALLLVSASTGRVAAQPQLVFVSPADGATEVPVSSSIVFVFDTVMETSLAVHGSAGNLVASIAWSPNIDPGLFSNQWDENAMVLTCNYLGDLPGSALISWTINPSSSLVKLGAEEDLLPVPTTSGSFTTAESGCDPDGIPDDFGTASIFKSVTYLQTSAAAPVLHPELLPNLLAVVAAPANDSVTAASFTHPGPGSPVELTGVFGQFLFLDEFATPAGLDAAYPGGTYTYNLTLASVGPTEFSMPMPAATSYPPVPQVSNHAAAQDIAPEQAFMLNFNGIPGATGGDYITLEIEDDQSNLVLSAPDLCIPLALPNTATSFTIPAGTLAAGKTYTARLTYARSFYSSTTSPPDFSSNGALLRQTVFTLATSGGTVVPPPQLTVAGFQSGFFELNVTGLQAGTTYRLQYSTTLQPGSWNLLQPIGSTTPMPVFDLDSNPTGGQRFYRVITP
jgi:hypothetical protein